MTTETAKRYFPTDDDTQLIEDLEQECVESSESGWWIENVVYVIESLTRRWKSEERRADYNLKSAHGWQENYNRVVRKTDRLERELFETQRKLDDAEIELRKRS